MSLLEICRWIQYSPPLVEMRGSPWVFPAIATVHLFGLAVIGGAVLLVDLRLLGLGIRGEPAAYLVRDAERWLIRGLMVALPTGVLLFMCFATKYYYLTFFWIKLAALVLVLLFTFSIRRRVALAADQDGSRARQRMVAVVSLTLWTTVAMGGRYIGFP
ncbi:MAG: hypothetical protein HY655_02835 [Acidobacteria bacterium]|nr:hypothetical protein [Acidobacteriota bacterium]